MERTNREAALMFLSQMSNPPAGLLADDFELVVMGYGPRGERRNASEIRALQEASAQAAAGDFLMKPTSVVASGGSVVVEAKGHLPLKSGEIYENEYSFHFECESGTIKRIRSYCDSAYTERFFPGV